MTRIKKQTGGGKAPARKIVKDSDDEGLWSLSPSPAPMKLRSTAEKGVEDKDSLPPQRMAKSTLGHKKVEVVVATMTGKSQKRRPSVITVGDTSSGSDYTPEKTHIADNDRDTTGSTSDILILEDEQVTSTRKCKAKSQQSSRATKKVAITLPDMNTRQLQNSKGVKLSSWKQSTKNTRLQIISTPDSTSSGQESNGNHPDRPESTVTPGFAQDTRLTTQMPVQMPPVSNPEVRPPSQEPRAGECKSSPVSARNTYLINAYLSAMQSQYTPSQVQDDRLGGILSRNECKPWSVSYIFSTQCTLLSNVIGEPSITDPRGSTGQCTHFTSTSL